jgi:DNA-binding NtrC family response regulator
MPIKKSVCVLLVHSDNNTMDALTLILRLKGYNVIVVRSNEEAIKRAALGDCDVLVSDLKPDGLELVRAIKLRFRMRAIAVSMHATVADRVSAKSAGYDRFIHTSDAFELLPAVVEELTADPRDNRDPAGEDNADDKDHWG